MPRRKHRQVEGPVSRTGQDQGRKEGSPLSAVWAPGTSEGGESRPGRLDRERLWPLTEDKEPLWPEARGQRGGRAGGPWRSSACLSSALSEVGSDPIVLAAVGAG